MAEVWGSAWIVADPEVTKRLDENFGPTWVQLLPKTVYFGVYFAHYQPKRINKLVHR
jgi:hypothetical protein